MARPWIPLVNLARQHEKLREEIEPLVRGIFASGEFILGRHVAEFEEAFAAYCETGFAVGVNSGTSALQVALTAAGIGSGDEVITTAFTFTATASAITLIGAKPVLVDIDPDTYTIHPEGIESAITPRTRAIVPVHLYGHPADMDPILDIARRHRLAVIEDAAQAHGAEYKGRRAGSLGDAGCFSFYPTKNLSACGEAGAIVTSRRDWADRARAIRDWGGGECAPFASNYRMEALHGAVLGVKLRRLDEWNAARRSIAARYLSADVAGGGLQLPMVRNWAQHVFHVFAIRAQERAAVIAAFQARGIETRIHYPVPIHLQERFRSLGYAPGDFPHAEKAAREVLSIPVNPELDSDEVSAVAQALREVSIESSADRVEVGSSRE